jgi:hypothetical protein
MVQIILIDARISILRADVGSAAPASPLPSG